MRLRKWLGDRYTNARSDTDATYRVTIGEESAFCPPLTVENRRHGQTIVVALHAMFCDDDDYARWWEAER